MTRYLGLPQPTVIIGDWSQKGSCIDAPTELFFGKYVAIVTNEVEQTKIIKAKAICAVCVVRQECLDYALEADEPDGIWGGATPPERWAMTRPVGAPRRRYK